MIIPNIWKNKKCSKPPIRPFLFEKKSWHKCEVPTFPQKNWGCQQLLSFQTSGIHETNRSCQNWLCKALRLTPVTGSHTNLLRFQCSATLAEHNKCANKPIKRTVCWKNTNWMPTNAYYPDSSARQIVESSTVVLPLHKKTHAHPHPVTLFTGVFSFPDEFAKKMGYLISSTGQLPFSPRKDKNNLGIRCVYHRIPNFHANHQKPICLGLPIDHPGFIFCKDKMSAIYLGPWTIPFVFLVPVQFSGLQRGI